MGCAFAVRRTAGPARWAFGPPSERAARNRQNWGREPGQAFAARRAAGLAAGPLRCPGRTPQPAPDRIGRKSETKWAELLRLLEPRSSPPPHAADCNSTELVALTAGGDPLKPKASSAIRRIAVLGEGDALAARRRRAEDELRRMGVINGLSFCDPLGRAGRTPPTGRPATRRSRVESCCTSRASDSPRSNQSRVEAASR